MKGMTPVLTNQGTMLVATRDAALVEELQRCGGADGWGLSRVSRGQDVLDHLWPVASERFRILILDDDLPDVRGGSLLPNIRDLDPDLKVIFVAGEATPEVEIEARREGVHFFLHKPVGHDILGRVIRKVMEHETKRYQLA